MARNKPKTFLKVKFNNLADYFDFMSRGSDHKSDWLLLFP